MRIVLIIVAALFGGALASGSEGLFGAALAAIAVYALWELAALRRRAGAMEAEIATLRRQRAAEAPATTTAAVRGDSPGIVKSSDGVPDAEPLADDTQRRSDGTDPTTRQSAGGAGPGPGVGLGAGATASDGVHDADAAALRSAAVGLEAAVAASAPGATLDPPSPPLNEAPLIRAIREWFTGGNTLVRAGVVILFIGVAFLLRYIAEHTYIPIQLRLSGVAIGGVVLLALGWRLRKKRAGYALALQGGAIGILYLTVFASLRLFSVMPPGPAFALLVVLAAFSAALGVLQSSQAFSLLAVGCGFLAPVLASSGQGNHVVLFSYYSVLNLAILAIAWFKAWRMLNVAGFLFTFVIGTAWGVLRYRPEFFATTEPFLIAFFLLYVAIAVLFSLRQRPVLRGYVEGTLVFGVPAVAFGLQAALVHGKPFVLAYSAVVVSALYLALAWMLHRGQRESQRLLVEAFMALGVLFLTLSVPLALDGRWSAATWALEGAALVWVGCRQGRHLPRAFGALLQIAGGIIFLNDVSAPVGQIPVLNSAYLGGVMIAFGSIFAARVLRGSRETLVEWEHTFAPVLFFWGLGWWSGSGFVEIERHVMGGYRPAAWLALFAATAVMSSELKKRFDLPAAGATSLALLPVMVVFALFVAFASLFVSAWPHPLDDARWAAWPLAFAAFYFVCRRHEREVGIAAILHVSATWLLVTLLTWEFAWQVDHAVKGSGSWPAIAWAVIPGVALFFMPKLRARLLWPVGAHEEAYVAVAGGGLVVALIVWSLSTNFTLRGDAYPLPYVPLLNPLDLAQAFVLLVLIRYWLHVSREQYRAYANLKWRVAAGVLAGIGFIWLNAVLLRTLHHWAQVPFDLDRMLESTLVQTSISIFWTVLALAAMLVATRRATRIVWISGATLLAVVVAKLFLVDLSSIGTVERIVSFVVVGLLMLVVGYFSPLPPAREKSA